MGNGGWFARTAAAVSFCDTNKTPSNRSDPCWLSPATHAEGQPGSSPLCWESGCVLAAAPRRAGALSVAPLLPALGYGEDWLVPRLTWVDVSLADNPAHVKGISCCGLFASTSLQPEPQHHVRQLRPSLRLFLLLMPLHKNGDLKWNKCFPTFSIQNTELLHWN